MDDTKLITADDTNLVMTDEQLQVIPTNADILPNCRLREPKNIVMRVGVPWVPIYCANCGCDGGLVPEEHCNFAFYQCEPCAEKWGALTGTMVVPDEIFWQEVHQAQMEKYGYILSIPEQVEALKDDNHLLSKLAKDRE